MEKNLTFTQHLIELRTKLIIALVFFIIFSISAYILFPRFIGYLNSTFQIDFHVMKVYEGFTIRIQVSLYIGLLLSLPVFLFNILLFILPALEKKEKTTFSTLFLLSLILYCTAIYAVRIFLPITIYFLESKAFIPDSLTKIFSYNEFISFYFKFTLAFCVALQFPVITLILLRFRILKRARLIKFIPYFIPVALLISAVMTQDLLSQFIVAIPLFILYLLCLAAAKLLKWG